MYVLAEAKHLKFNVHIASDVPEAIHADGDALTKIITNLLGNAFKFTEKGEVTLSLAWRDRQLEIKAADTGIGIPLHMQELIFESFYQVDSSSSRAHGGTGLGLSIVRQLCAAMNGTVQVQSVVGQGSTFTVLLPLEAETEAAA
jgi:signal transduction histidine kinase